MDCSSSSSPIAHYLIWFGRPQIDFCRSFLDPEQLELKSRDASQHGKSPKLASEPYAYVTHFVTPKGPKTRRGKTELFTKALAPKNGNFRGSNLM